MKHFYSIFIFLLFSAGLSAQPEYNMQNLLVTDCEGIFLDSDEGAEEGQYAHNEDYVFTICIEGATEIIVAFNFFATEANYDILTAYDGPDVNSPVIAELSGVLQPPPTLVATSGCITFHFISDENIAAQGWEAVWSVEIDEPIPPVISLVETPECPMETALFEFSVPVPCDLFIPDNFNLVGPGAGEISSVNVLDCDPETNTGQTFEVIFSNAPDIPGNYRLFFEGVVPDACDELHEIQANFLFPLENCPLAVDIELIDGAACPGDCAEIRANVFGGSGNYNYNWSHTASNSAVVEICADDLTSVSVTVTDIQGGQTADATFEYLPLELPIFLNPLEADTFCASRGDHIYQVSLPGGQFFSEIIPGGHRETGRYQFWRWGTADPLNMDVIEYIAPNGCSVTDTVFVQHIRIGNREAACLDAEPFEVIEPFPLGGYWTGPHIDSSGLFTPAEEGSFVIRYHAPNGCTQSKRVNVGAELIMPDVDTICSSQRIDLEASIYGGRWYGPGITNRILGRLEAWRVTPNQSYTYTYILEGCEAEMEIYVKELSAGSDRVVCTADSLLYLPFSGDWGGPAPYIEDINAFDISSLSAGTYVFEISLGDCTDAFELRIEDVSAGLHTDAYFCRDEDYYWLGDYMWVHPGGGSLSGPGVSFFSDTWFFNPAEAGVGEHWIVYETLGCRDSVRFEVEAAAEIPDFIFCDRNNPAILNADPAGGSWSGAGFLDEASGLFDPSLAGVGSHEVTYFTPFGCATTSTVEVTPFEAVSISGFVQQYCYNDTLIQLQLEPEGGNFTINGQSAEPEFNPVDLGTGTHELLYRRGTGECASSERRFITVLPPISLQYPLENDSICPGENTVVEALAEGGIGGLSYNWDGGLGFGNSQVVFLSESSWFRVTVSDECSQPLVDSLYVHVNDSITYSVNYGPEVCYGDTTFAELVFDPNVDYNVNWIGFSETNGTRLDAGPGLYTAEIQDMQTGCSEEIALLLPGARPIRSNFSFFPNQACIDLARNRLEIINLSVGYDVLWVDFGAGDGWEDYSDGSLISHEYEFPGDYRITMLVRNDLGCEDTLSKPICVENVVRLYVPNAFSPNGDGTNDFLELFPIGVREDIHWMIFDRFGGKVFESFSLYDQWDGTFRAEPLSPGVFIFTATYYDRETGQQHYKEQAINLLR